MMQNSGFFIWSSLISSPIHFTTNGWKRKKKYSSRVVNLSCKFSHTNIRKVKSKRVLNFFFQAQKSAFLHSHYSKSQIFVQTFSRVFHPTFFFWQCFSWNQSRQQLKSPKPQHFHEFFTQKIDNFLGKSKLNFWTKMKISNSVSLKNECWKGLISVDENKRRGKMQFWGKLMKLQQNGKAWMKYANSDFTSSLWWRPFVYCVY